MSRKPDGKPAKVERVTFTRPAAERIAKTVRAVEAGDRSQPGIEFGSVPGVSTKTFRVCTFTGAWSIGSAKTVTFKNQTTTPNTVSATNLFFPVTSTAAATKDCAIAKDGTAWYLIDVPLATATAVFVTSAGTSALLTDMTLSAVLNTSDCTITIGKTLSTTSITLITGTVTATYLTLR